MKKVQVINTAKTAETADYYYDCKRDTFGSMVKPLAGDLVILMVMLSDAASTCIFAGSGVTVYQLSVMTGQPIRRSIK